jgi:DNA-binding NarL/FixJ family response regulator
MTPARERIAVFLIAENRLLLEVLTKVLGKKNDIAIAGACAFSDVAIQKIINSRPDVLVLDSFTAEEPYLELMREALAAVQDLKVVTIGMDANESMFFQAVRTGVVGYVLKDASALEVVASVRAVANGKAVCPPELCLALFRRVAQQWSQMPSFQVRASLGLTAREQQLVGLIGRGLTNKEIAAQLQLSEQTIRNHVHRMLRKVGAPDRLGVVEMCRLQGLAV